MEHLRQKKPNYAFFVFLFFAALYLGYCLGTLYGKEISIETISDLLLTALKNPLPVTVTDWTWKTIGACLAVWAVFIFSQMANMHHFMFGLEYGSARFARPEEQNKELAEKELHRNKILSENLRLSLDSRKSKVNNNMLVIGGSGSGKSFYIVKPNALNCESSYVFCDPNGYNLGG